MTSRPARIAMVAVGTLLLLTGGIWVGQGLNLIPGSFMTGVRTWFYIGLIVVVVGAILVVLGLRRTHRKEKS